MEFSNKEQKAILQCLWQLFSANPSKEECDYVKNVIAKGWTCTVGKEFGILDKISLVHQGMLKELHTDYGWISCAIEEDPYESFYVVSQLPAQKKLVFKRIVKDCVEHYGDTNYKTAMAVSLFNNTNVEFGIRGKDWINDNHNGSQTII